MTRFNKTLLTALSITAATLATTPAQAGGYPSRPIKIVVPYAAGGTIDVMARRVAPKLSELLGQTIVIDNKAGGGTIIGADAVARAEPDGYTLFMGSNAAFTISPQLMKVPYDPLRSFSAISTLATFPNIILVPPSSPYKTFGDLVEAAKKEPGKLSYASFGIGSTAQLSGEAIKTAAGLDITHVPYKSGAQCVQAIVAGEVSFGFDTAVGAVQRVKAGQLRALAVTSSKRLSDLPDVPSVAEVGFGGTEVIAWVGLFAPANTPADVQKTLARALQRVLSDPEIKRQFASMGVEVSTQDAEATMQMLRREYVQIGKLIEKAKIRIE